MIFKRLMSISIHHKWKKYLILSNVINYVWYNRNPIDYYKLAIRDLEQES